MEPIKLYESLFFFHKCNLILQEQKQQLLSDSDSKIEFGRPHILITNYIVMESVSFIDEFERNFHYRCEPEFKDKVVLVRKLTEPIFKRIKQWSDLKEFRNNIIAHPWRDKDKSFTIPDNTKYNTPRNWFEHVVLVNLLGYVYGIIKHVFNQEFYPMTKYMQSLVPPEKEKTNYQELTKDHVAMAIEVDEIAKKEGYNYDMNVMGYLFD